MRRFVDLAKSGVERIPLGLNAYAHRLVREVYSLDRNRGRRSGVALANTLTPERIRKRDLIVIYDHLASPPTIGDFLLVVMLARYLCHAAGSLEFFIATGEERNDWDDLTEASREHLQITHTSLLKRLLPRDKSTIRSVSWDELEIILRDVPADTVVVGGVRRAQARLPLYNEAFNTLNALLDGDTTALEEFLLTADDFGPPVDVGEPQGGYIALHARYSESWAPERNLAPESLIRMIHFLRELFTLAPIVVVSDDAGCDYFRRISEQFGLELKFSKDYSNSFIGDCNVVLQSDVYLQFRGGGIGVVPMFSRVPYVIVDPAANEVAWSRRKFCSFASPQQVRTDSESNLETLFEKCRQLHQAF
jgi:hypothetical protein